MIYSTSLSPPSTPNPIGQLDAYLRITEGFPLQDDVYAWIVRTFPSCTRPPPIESDASGCFRRHRRRRPHDGDGGGGQSWIRRAPAGVENDGSGGDGGADVKLDLCLTRHGFLDMYRCMWQAAGRDLEASRRLMLMPMLRLRVKRCVA